MDKESFENVNANEQDKPVHNSTTEQFAKTSKLNSHNLDIFAAFGLAMVIIELALYLL